LVAIYILYVIYKKWNEQDKEEADDPFTNLEKQWDELKRS
ncbi:flagellar basal body rod protein, partial [Staphylococcus sp. SIMBA_130]